MDEHRPTKRRSTNPTEVLRILWNMVANDDRVLVEEQDVQQLPDVEKAPEMFENKNLITD